MDDSRFMSEALALAARGWPAVSPNPMVGCLIVWDGKVVGAGYHQRYGAAHAEVEAIDTLPPEIKPEECTLYVTLEPCSHHGKTPPCADLIIQKGFKEVVIATLDPNPLVAGKGAERLKNAGIKVRTGVLEKEARQLNIRFFTFHQEKRPFVILKWAMTADGFISRIPLPSNKEENKITRPESDKLVHKMRSQISAIMVGKNTVLADNPVLTTRLVPGRNPVRVTIDQKLEIPDTAAILNEEAGTIVFNGVKEKEEAHLLYLKLDFSKNILPELLAKLHQLQIQTLMVEGGAKLLRSFIEQELWDEAYVFQNPDLKFGQGIPGPVFPIKNTFELVGDDKLFHHFRTESMPSKGALSKEIF